MNLYEFALQAWTNGFALPLLVRSPVLSLFRAPWTMEADVVCAVVPRVSFLVWRSPFTISERTRTLGRRRKTHFPSEALRESVWGTDQLVVRCVSSSCVNICSITHTITRCSSAKQSCVQPVVDSCMMKASCNESASIRGAERVWTPHGRTPQCAARWLSRAICLPVRFGLAELRHRGFPPKRSLFAMCLRSLASELRSAHG